MKVMRKTRISVALAAALAGVGASTQVLAVNKSADDIGDAFIGPYYTVRGGWSTDFTVINTSNSTVPVKVRFHEANNSREVLDFIVVLSPQDMVQAIVQDGPDGPRLNFPAQGETSCVVPNPIGRPINGSGGYLPFKNTDYTGVNRDYNDDADGDIDRAREGYFTIIAMGAAIPGAETMDGYEVPVASNHASLDCQTVIDRFDPANMDWVLDTYNDFERNVNALKASYSLTNVARGVQGSGEMVTLANFATTYALLNPTPVWREWANRENEAFAEALAAANSNLNTAAATLKAIDNKLVSTYGCTSRLTNSNGLADNPATDWPEGYAPGPIPPGESDAPWATASTLNKTGDSQDPPPNPITNGYAYGATTIGNAPDNAVCDLNAIAPAVDAVSPADRQAWADAAANYNAAVSGYNNALYNNALAEVAIASTRVRNLISAQGKFNSANPADRIWSKYPNLDSGDLVAINNWDGEYLMGPWYCAHAFPSDWQLANEVDTRACPMQGVSWVSGHIRGVDAVTMLLMSSDIVNEWAVNPVTGASSDWILTAPTKRFYTDYRHIYTGLGNYQILLEGALTSIYEIIHGKIPSGAIPPFSEEWNNVSFQSCDEVAYNVYNRDEGAPGAPGPQPSPHGSVQLCDEVNVLHFNGAPMMDSKVAQKIPEAAGLGTNGWLGLDLTASFASPALDNSQWHPVVGVSLTPFPLVAGLVSSLFDAPPQGPITVSPDALFHWNYVVGMPVVGFMFKERNLGQAASYGGIVEHSYIREVGAHDASVWDVWPIAPGASCEILGICPPLLDD